jgi:LmbE family N-acetylglucosaminyl deacetylase
VPTWRQLYAELPDSALDKYRDELDNLHAMLIEKIQPDAIYTTGPDGYDSHSDHIEVHDSIVRVVRRLGTSGITLYCLNSKREGSLVVPASTRKLGAMACHVSQRTHEDITFWGNTDLYRPLIVDAETYTPLYLEKE